MAAIDLRELMSSTGSAAMVTVEEATSAGVPATSARTATAQVSAGEGVAAREGFWINVGLGAGSLGCEGCDDRLTGPSGNLALGESLSGGQVLLRVFVNSWTKSEDGVTLTAGTVTGGFRPYPSRTNGFFFTGGVGLGTVDLDTEVFGSANDAGAGTMVGLGYDIRVGRAISIMPCVNGVGVSIEGNTANFVQGGLGIPCTSRWVDASAHKRGSRGDRFPAEAGAQGREGSCRRARPWIPAFAGERSGRGVRRRVSSEARSPDTRLGTLRLRSP